MVSSSVFSCLVKVQGGVEDLCKLQLVCSCCIGSSPVNRCLLLASGPAATVQYSRLVSLTFCVAVCVRRLTGNRVTDEHREKLQPLD